MENDNSKTIVFHLGEETSPKLHSFAERGIYDEGKIGGTYFNEVFEKALRLVGDILEKNKAIGKKINDNNISDEDFLQVRNNIITFVGNRGTGKTSCMQTIYKCLIEGPDNREKFVESTCLPQSADEKRKLVLIGYTFASIPVIDPSYLEERHNVLEIVVAHMFNRFEQAAKSNSRDCFGAGDKNQDLKNKLVKAFQGVKECLDMVYQKERKSGNSIEDLANLSGNIQLREKIADLVKSYLAFFDRKIMLIAIDDLDIQSHYAYEMAEQIRKYLILPNVIILNAVKLNQLHDILKQHFYVTMKDLIDHNQLTDTIENMSSRYLAKLFPLNQRVYLPHLNELSNCKIVVYIGNDKMTLPDTQRPSGQQENSSNASGQQENPKYVSDFIQRLIYTKTHYWFCSSQESPSLIIPTNLRDLLNFISLLCHMDDPVDDSSKEREMKNRKQFRDYFTYTWCSKNLPSEMFGFVLQMEDYQLSQLNKRVIEFTLTLSGGKAQYDNQKKDEELYIVSGNVTFEKNIVLKENNPSNMSFGDVNYVLTKRCNELTIPGIVQFKFAIQTMYSFMLYQLLDDDTQAIDDAKTLQYVLTNKILASRYEQFIGGNLLRTQHLGKALLESTNGVWNNGKLEEAGYYHLREIDSNVLFALNEALDKSEVEEPIILFYIKRGEGCTNILSYKEAFNIWEFFILTTYLKNIDEEFRFSHECYYADSVDSFPMSYKGRICFSSISILFNIIKLQHYYAHRTDKNITDAKWKSFWERIEKHKEESLIYRLLNHPDIKKTYIKNFDILDKLRSCLQMKSIVTIKNNVYDEEYGFTKNDIFPYNDAIAPYTLFFKTLVDFQYDNHCVAENENFMALRPICTFLESLGKKDENDVKGYMDSLTKIKEFYKDQTDSLIKKIDTKNKELKEAIEKKNGAKTQEDDAYKKLSEADRQLGKAHRQLSGTDKRSSEKKEKAEKEKKEAYLNYQQSKTFADESCKEVEKISLELGPLKRQLDEFEQYMEAVSQEIRMIKIIEDKGLTDANNERLSVFPRRLFCDILYLVKDEEKNRR